MPIYSKLTITNVNTNETVVEGEEVEIILEEGEAFRENSEVVVGQERYSWSYRTE